MKIALYGWTDYPFVELGDMPGKRAPVRACKAVPYDRNKYIAIDVAGVSSEIKRGYFYKKAGRCGNVPPFSHRACTELKRSMP